MGGADHYVIAELHYGIIGGMGSGDFSQLRLSISGVASCDIAGLDARGLAEELGEITAAQDLLEAERVRRLARFDELKAAPQLGHRNSAAFLTFRLGLDPGAAAERLRLARQSDGLRPTIEALGTGAITYEQAAIISNAADRLDDKDVADLQTTVLPHAVGGLDPVRFRHFVKAVADAIDKKTVDGDAGRAHRARFLTLGPDRDGSASLQGRLELDLSAYLRALLDAKMGAPAKDDERTPGQRRHDALKDVCREMLEGTVKLPKRRGRAVRPILSATAEKWETGVGPAVLLNNRVPIDLETAREMAAGIAPTELEKPRNENPNARAFAPGQRDVIEFGSGYCDWPGGCGEPAEWSETNHKVRYADGGPTVVENGETLCRFHNQLLEKGWCTVVDGLGRRRALAPDDPENPGPVHRAMAEARADPPVRSPPG